MRKTLVIDYANRPRDLGRASEDYILACPGLYGVFDSVGGRDQGRLVSHLAGQAMEKAWWALAEKERQQQKEVLEALIRQADKMIAGLPIPDGQKRPATVAALCALSGETDHLQATIAHIGDSRVYRLRPGQGIERLTQDQGYFPFAVRLHRLSEKDALRIEQAEQEEELSPEDLDHFRRRNQITCAIGWSDFPWIPTRSFEVAPGDILLLCTDGLHDNLTDNEIEALLTTDAHSLVAAAYERSHQIHFRAKPDDISAIVIRG